MGMQDQLRWIALSVTLATLSSVHADDARPAEAPAAAAQTQAAATPQLLQNAKILQEQALAIARAKDAEERERLLREHMASMQTGMMLARSMMAGTPGGSAVGGMMGRQGIGGMMGRGMMGHHGMDHHGDHHGMMGRGMMGPGMMGPGMTGPGMMGPGMMGPGMMGPGMMGPGMMGQGMMGQGMMGQGMMGQGMMGPGMMGPGMMDGAIMIERLAGIDLSDEQRRRINAIHDQARKQRWELMGRLLDEQARLRDLYAAERIDPQAVGAQYQRIFDLRRQMIETSLVAHNQMEEVLPAEQRQTLRQFMARMHSGGGMMGY